VTAATPITIVAPLPHTELAAHRNLLAHMGLLLDRALGVRPDRAPSLPPLPPGDAQAASAAVDQLVAVLRERSIHFLSFFIIDHAGQDQPREVVLEINCNGGRAACFRAVATTAPQFVRLLYRPCGVDQGSSTGTLVRFLRGHDVGADVYHVGCPGRTVSQIQQEHQLREQMRGSVAGVSGECASELWMQLQRAASADAAAAALVGERVRRPFRVRWGLNPRGARARLREGLRLLALPLLTLLALYGFVRAVLPPGGPLRLPLLLAPIALALVIAIWLLVREAPVHGRRLRALPAFLGSLLSIAVAAAAVIGAVWLLRALPAAMARLAADPTVLSVVIGVATFGFLLLAAALVYVLAGRVAAVFALLGAGLWCAHVAFDLDHPRELAWCAARVVGITTLVAAAGLLWLLVAIRRKELAEQVEPAEVDLARLDALTELEDWQPQNHLATVTPLKDGTLRRYVLTIVLRFIQLAARWYFNHGRLASIACIHFGRFVILESPPRLLFLGNYDGGFAAYLGAFASAPGTTAVWSNTKGLQRAHFLIGEGARDEERFKAFGRSSQVPTLGWFSAYPTLSVQDVDAATATREALRLRAGPWQPLIARFASALGIDTLGDRVTCGQAAPPGPWSERVAAIVRDPIEEAGCDAALRRL
jgi:hypothetical protein